MGKALEEIERVLDVLKGRGWEKLGITRLDKEELLLITWGQKAVIIGLEDIAKAIRER